MCASTGLSCGVVLHSEQMLDKLVIVILREVVVGSPLGVAKDSAHGDARLKMRMGE